MQFCKYVNGVAIPESRLTEMTGSNKLVQDIKFRFNIRLLKKGGKCMIESKPWDWSKNESTQWLIPTIESWKSKGFKKFLDLGCGLGRH